MVVGYIDPTTSDLIGKVTPPPGFVADTDPNESAKRVIGAITIGGLVLAVIFLVYGGIKLISSEGDPGKIKEARSTIMYALIGLVLVATAGIIANFVYLKLTGQDLPDLPGGSGQVHESPRRSP